MRHVGMAVMLACVAVTLGSCLSQADASADARFSAPVFKDTGGFEVDEVVAADVTADGNADLVAATESGRVTVFPGVGDGTLRSRLTSETAAHPIIDTMWVADVNADGAPDVVFTRASHWRRGFVDVLFNDGSGRFRRSARYSTHGVSFSLDVADVNRDGIVDLVVGHPGGRPLPELSVLLGTGGGRFAPPRALSGPGVSDFALADLNGDGKLDATVLSNDSDRVAVRLGNGDGTFGPLTEFGAAESFTSVAMADLNHDGRIDVVAALYQGNGVRVMLGNGDGSLGRASAYRTSTDLGSLILADLDGDGNSDLVTTPVISERSTMRAGRGDGTFGPARPLRWATLGPLSVADFNGDGRPELAAVGEDLAGDLLASMVLNWTGLAAPPCVVPPVTRLRLAVVRRDIRDAGCRLGSIRPRRSRRIGTNRVIAQRPHLGTILPPLARVNLIVSRGRRG